MSIELISIHDKPKRILMDPKEPLFQPNNFLLYFTDPECHQMIVAENGIEAIVSLLNHSSSKVIENSIATLLQLDSAETHSTIFSALNRSKIKPHQQSSSPVLRNLAQIFLETDQHVDLPSCSTNSTQ